MSEWGFIQSNSVTTQPFISIGVAEYAASPWCANNGVPMAASPAINATHARSVIVTSSLPATTAAKPLWIGIGIAARRIALLLQVLQRFRGYAEPFIDFLIRDPTVVVRSE